MDPCVENYVGKLMEECQRRGIRSPEYGSIKQTGPPHKPEFTASLTLFGTTVTGSGLTKQKAKWDTARKALEVLGRGTTTWPTPTLPSLRSVTGTVMEKPLNEAQAPAASNSTTDCTESYSRAGPARKVPKFDPQHPRQSLDALLQELNIPPVVISFKSGINFPLASARIEPSRASPDFQPINEEAFFTDEATAYIQICQQLYTKLLNDVSVRKYIDDKFPERASPSAQKKVSASYTEAQSPTKKIKSVPEWKKTLFHYKKIVSCLKTTNEDNEAAAKRLSLQLEQLNDVGALEKLGELENFSVIYENFPKHPVSKPSGYVVRLLDAYPRTNIPVGTERQRLRICRITFENKFRDDPILHFHGMGCSEGEADLNCAKNALRYLSLMEEKIAKGLA